MNEMTMTVTPCKAVRHKLHYCQQISTSTAQMNWMSRHVHSYYATHSVITAHAAVLHQWHVFVPVNHTHPSKYT